MKILITGGPVHAKLDAVKFVTNRFKGGLMAKLAIDMITIDDEVEVVYLTSKDAKTPAHPGIKAFEGRIEVVYHDGFHDYRKKVIEMAPEFDAVVLGAAVANLIPVSYTGKGVQVGMFDHEHEQHELPLKGKFPSHDYKPGDTFQMTWKIAPRIIDEVKPVMKKGAHLFGFKLLGGVSYEELVSAAYGVLLESKATAVFANDVSDLSAVTILTKERGQHPIGRDGIGPFILECLKDEYYSTKEEGSDGFWPHRMNCAYLAGALGMADKSRFLETPEGYVFGTVAMRHPDDNGFVTTARGKKELDGVVHVIKVDHEKRVVHTADGKATLNAPLLASIFEDERVDHIEHYHDHVGDLPTMDYAPPGTVRDSRRLPVLMGALGAKGWTSFNIHNHGCFLLFDKEGNQL